jgi:hypothetical protein
VLVVSAPVLCVPLADNAPLQPPEAVHEVALAELQVKVAPALLSTAVCDELSKAVG